MVSCPHCKALNDDKAAECRQCGRTLPTGPLHPKAVPAPTKTCPKCGFNAPSAARYCPNCGLKPAIDWPSIIRNVCIGFMIFMAGCGIMDFVSGGRTQIEIVYLRTGSGYTVASVRNVGRRDLKNIRIHAKALRINLVDENGFRAPDETIDLHTATIDSLKPGEADSAVIPAGYEYFEIDHVSVDDGRTVGFRQRRGY